MDLSKLSKPVLKTVRYLPAWWYRPQWRWWRAYQLRRWRRKGFGDYKARCLRQWSRGYQPIPHELKYEFKPRGIVYAYVRRVREVGNHQMTKPQLSDENIRAMID